MTSQVSAAPTTSPTMSSHQLNSAFTRWPPGGPSAEVSCAGQYRRGGPGDLARAATYTPPTMIDITPDPIAFQIGSFPDPLVRDRLRRRARGRLLGPRPRGALPRRRTRSSSATAMIVVAIAALDRRPALPRDRPVAALRGRPDHGDPADRPPGRRVVRLRRLHGPRRPRRDRHRHDRGVVPLPAAGSVSFWTWADIVAPGLFVMQAIGRFGNFFNQELYGPPTTLPWGIAIDCAHRVAAYPCDAFPLATTALPAAVPVRVAVRAHRRR